MQSKRAVSIGHQNLCDKAGYVKSQHGICSLNFRLRLKVLKCTFVGFYTVVCIPPLSCPHAPLCVPFLDFGQWNQMYKAPVFETHTDVLPPPFPLVVLVSTSLHNGAHIATNGMPVPCQGHTLPRECRDHRAQHSGAARVPAVGGPIPQRCGQRAAWCLEYTAVYPKSPKWGIFKHNIDHHNWQTRGIPQPTYALQLQRSAPFRSHVCVHVIVRTDFVTRTNQRTIAYTLRFECVRVVI